MRAVFLDFGTVSRGDLDTGPLNRRGGRVSSTLLARLVTPVMYELLPPTIEPAAGTVAAGVALPA